MIVGMGVKRKGDWSGAADTITLEEQARQRRRMAMVSDGGIAFLLDLPDTRELNDGDAIVLDDGRFLEVRAKPEALLRVEAGAGRTLASLAWQLGRRRVPMQAGGDHILTRRDDATREVLAAYGARIVEVDATFNPEVDPAAEIGLPAPRAVASDEPPREPQRS